MHGNAAITLITSLLKWGDMEGARILDGEQGKELVGRENMVRNETEGAAYLFPFAECLPFDTSHPLRGGSPNRPPTAQSSLTLSQPLPF